MRSLWTGVALSLMSGCVALSSGCASSEPLRFYTLSEVGATAGGAGAPSSNNGVRVGRVRIPAELDRSQLVQRIDANRLRIAEQDRWAAPLDDMIRRVLAADLQARAATGTSLEGAVVAVDIDEFVGDASCSVVLRASWELQGGGANAAPLGSGREIIRVPGSSGTCTASALPAAMSEALAQLSERILSH